MSLQAALLIHLLLLVDKAHSKKGELVLSSWGKACVFDQSVFTGTLLPEKNKHQLFTVSFKTFKRCVGFWADVGRN